ARSRISIHENRVLDHWTQNIKERLPQAVRRRTNIVARHRQDHSGTELTGNHAHSALRPILPIPDRIASASGPVYRPPRSRSPLVKAASPQTPSPHAALPKEYPDRAKY